MTILSSLPRFSLLYVPFTISFDLLCFIAVPLYLEERGIGIKGCLVGSAKIISRHFGTTLKFIATCAIIQCVGAAVFGIGLFYTIPTMIVAYVLYYHELVGISGVKRWERLTDDERTLNAAEEGVLRPNTNNLPSPVSAPSFSSLLTDTAPIQSPTGEDEHTMLPATLPTEFEQLSSTSNHFTVETSPAPTASPDQLNIHLDNQSEEEEEEFMNMVENEV